MASAVVMENVHAFTQTGEVSVVVNTLSETGESSNVIALNDTSAFPTQTSDFLGVTCVHTGEILSVNAPIKLIGFEVKPKEDVSEYVSVNVGELVDHMHLMIPQLERQRFQLLAKIEKLKVASSPAQKTLSRLVENYERTRVDLDHSEKCKARVTTCLSQSAYADVDVSCLAFFSVRSSVESSICAALHRIVAEVQAIPALRCCPQQKAFEYIYHRYYDEVHIFAVTRMTTARSAMKRAQLVFDRQADEIRQVEKTIARCDEMISSMNERLASVELQEHVQEPNTPETDSISASSSCSVSVSEGISCSSSASDCGAGVMLSTQSSVEEDLIQAGCLIASFDGRFSPSGIVIEVPASKCFHPSVASPCPSVVKAVPETGSVVVCPMDPSVSA